MGKNCVFQLQKSEIRKLLLQIGNPNLQLCKCQCQVKVKSILTMKITGMRTDLKRMSVGTLSPDSGTLNVSRLSSHLDKSCLLYIFLSAIWKIIIYLKYPDIGNFVYICRVIGRAMIARMSYFRYLSMSNQHYKLFTMNSWSAYKPQARHHLPASVSSCCTQDCSQSWLSVQYCRL